MTRSVPIAVCVLASTVTLGVAVNAGARAGGLAQTGEPVITGQMTFAGGTWTATRSGADFDKPDPGGYAGHYSWFIPQTIPAEGADAQLIVTAEGRGARHNACAKVVLSGIAVSGGPAGNQVCTLAEVGRTESTTANFRLTPQSSSGFIEIQMQDGPQVHFNYGAAATPDPCATAKRACNGETVAIPSPGESATVKGPLAGGAPKADVAVTSSDGNLAGTTIVGEGHLSSKEEVGEAVAACWFAGPAAIVPDNHKLKKVLSGDRFTKIFKEVENSPAKTLSLCIKLVQLLTPGAGPARSRSASGGCAQQIVISGKEKNGKFKLGVGNSKDLPKTAVKYSCTETADGGAQLTVKSSNKKGLRGELGKTLDLGVVRAPDAPPSDATLTFAITT